jgi:hypothetical protein
MRLADDEIGFKAGSEAILLRPSLRAALRLERRHGGFDALLKAISHGNLTVMADIIREGATEPSCFPDFLEGLNLMPLRSRLDVLTVPLAAFVFALAGMGDDQDPVADKAQAKPITFAEYHTKLFGIATGWLGWSPETAWTSTPAEITTAYKARLDMLKAVFGSGDDKTMRPARAAFEAAFPSCAVIDDEAVAPNTTVTTAA